MTSYIREVVMDYNTKTDLQIVQEIFGKIYGEKLYGEIGGDLSRLLEPTKSQKVRMLAEYARRLIASTVKANINFSSSVEVANYYIPRFAGKKQEEFLVVMLNARNGLIEDKVISIGSLTASIVHPREVFKAAVMSSAAAVIFIHNHPSGDPAPSQDDLKITAQLVETGKVLDIRVLDHLVIGGGKFVSFAGKGLL